jgi:hypothetical protein
VLVPSLEVCVCPIDFCPADVSLASGQEIDLLPLRTFLPTSFIVFAAAGDCWLLTLEEKQPEISMLRAADVCTYMEGIPCFKSL